MFRRRGTYLERDLDPVALMEEIAAWMESEGYDGELEESESGAAVVGEKAALWRILTGGARGIEIQAWGDADRLDVESRLRRLPANLAAAASGAVALTLLGLIVRFPWAGLIALPFQIGWALAGLPAHRRLWAFLRDNYLGEPDGDAATEEPPANEGEEGFEEEAGPGFDGTEPEPAPPPAPPPRRATARRVDRPDPTEYTAKSPYASAGPSAKDEISALDMQKSVLNARVRAGSLNQAEFERQAKELGRKRLALQGIARLEAMRDLGQLDQAEFESRKAELLRRVENLDVPDG